MKLGDIPYKRVIVEDLKADFDQLLIEFKSAEDVEGQLKVYDKYIEMVKDVSTYSALSFIRFTQNVEDKFYCDEKDYYDNTSPIMKEMAIEFIKLLVTSKFRKELEERLSPLLFQRYETELLTFNPSIIEDMQEENKLTTEYVKLMSSGKVEFNGEMLSISELNKYKLSKDREIRKQAYNTHGAFLESNSETIDRIFDSLVKVRTNMAKKLGLKDYVEFAYLMRNRNSYDREAIAKFREEILKDIVPAISKLREKQKQELGIDKVMLYDDPIVLKNGDPTPKGTAEDIMEAGRKMYSEMSPLTKEFFDYMIEHDSFDVLARKNKSGGGYCTTVPNYKLPFIFSNFNGTSADVDVLTHEAGHAFHDYVSKDRRLFDLQVGSGPETYEVHSMSMEFFAWEHMDKFYDNPEEYKRSHFAGAVCFLPYGTIVDYFQHIMYENPDLTPAERNKVWQDLESKFRPYLSAEGITYLEKGTRWQYQIHIFEHPFYYIDYCLAQTVALNFLVMIEKDRELAWKKYMEFIYNSEKKFTDILSTIGFKSPFEEGVLAGVAKLVDIYY